MDLLITILTLLAAVYAVVPRDRQLDLNLRLGSIEWSILGVGFVAVIYLEFYDFVAAHGWVLKEPWLPGITPRNSIYLVILVVTVVLWIRLRFFAHLTMARVNKFRELVEELFWSERYGELLTLLQRHLKELLRIYHLDFWRPRIRTWLESFATFPKLDPKLFQELLEAVKVAPGVPGKSSRGKSLLDRPLRLLPRLAPYVVRLMPSYEKSEQTARDIVRGIFLSPRFVSALARTRPYFGIEIIRAMTKCQERFDFVEFYLRELIREPQSILYGELFNNQNCGVHRYDLSSSNRLLYFLLSDTRAAKDNHVYKPIGDFAITHLRELGRDHNSDPYNRAWDPDFYSQGKWNSPLFATIRFFDIMVKEALFQGTEWHMWLYYFPDIVKGMARNYTLVDPQTDIDGEWPIIYSYLLYEAFAAMAAWVIAAEEVPADQPNGKLKSTRLSMRITTSPRAAYLL